MKPLNDFQSILDSPHKAAVDWKQETGGRILGGFCRYIPEELIHASGALPISITGEMDQFGNAGLYLQENTCPYLRSCLGKGISGDYACLDGVVVTHGCDLMSNMQSLWKNRTEVPHTFFIDFPHKVSDAALTYYQGVLDTFREFLEDLTGKPIKPDDLSRSIQLYNEYRDLLRQVHELRSTRPARLSGSEALTVFLAASLIPKETAVPMLKTLLSAAGNRDNPASESVPVFITGTDVSNLSLFQFIESCGATIVGDDLCTGTRYFSALADESLEPLEALARHYTQGVPPCSRTSPSDDRYSHILKAYKQSGARGIVIPLIDFCDAHRFDAPYVTGILEKEGIPTLSIEIDFTRGGLEQLRNNVEGFVEFIEMEDQL